MEAHNLNLVIMMIVLFTLCIYSQDIRESRQYPQSFKRKKSFIECMIY